MKVGHFRRFAHDKVLIQKRNGQPVKVLTGSANFSIRGLYVQANNVLVFDDPTVAGDYGRAFDQAFTDMAGFSQADVAQHWFDIGGTGLPTGSVSFAPHTSSSQSLDDVAKAIKAAKSSIIFAVMELGGSGEVLDALSKFEAGDDVFWYGMSQSKDGLKVFPPNAKKGIFASFAFLDKRVPAPFRKEWRGGQGQVIHHKFVVVDFNRDSPVVFTGSSNLAAGGEEANGDNLLAIHDPAVASAYAVEGIRLVDHYQFRAAMTEATTASPLILKQDKDRWWAPYYDEGNVKFRDRRLFGS
jgi:phosphatidylserine/phosphatidylglycerophosphate/cardiolipin synthase-like enzyme